MAETRIFNPYISVDCVVFGYDGESLKLLTIKRQVNENDLILNDRKLPGSIILENEDLDSAANRTLLEYTGLRNIYLHEFKAFGDPNRCSEKDKLWLERTTNINKFGRIVTISYISLIILSPKVLLFTNRLDNEWLNIENIEKVPFGFDHKKIVLTALERIRVDISLRHDILFELLPKKFTMSQLRNLYDNIFQTNSDVRNFQKKMMTLPGLTQLSERERGVSHRAARYYTYKRSIKKI